MDITPLFGREKEIDRLKGLILTGQSSTVMGMFELERTAILGYLSDPTLYGEYADKLVFSRLDMAADLPKDPADFWQLALRPLEDKCQESPTLLKLYQSCSQNQFDEYCLDKLIVQLKQEGWRLVLMLDRFDELLRSPNFKENGKFLATLRKLASSRSPSSLCLIISWGLSLQEFHEVTKNLNKGSPYFNFMGEVVLGALSDSEIDNLLNKDFSEPERQFLKEVTGRHPYLLQLAVSALQATKKQGETEPLEMARKDFSKGVENMLASIIYSWNTKGVCKAIASLVKEGKALELSNNELSLLEKQGFLVKDCDGQWQVSPRVLVDFINSKMEQELCNR
ncbi:MAG: hypothetical protein BWK78_08990 [Thiotrichaceae bacterium IS1]|nr:MAG: hypothetical protein BWK78_08990 [Thiotrichaceae bacterium IS1]